MKSEAEMRQSCDVLKVIAEQYPHDSTEFLTLQKAAIALQLIRQHNFGFELEELHNAIGTPLTEEQKNHLRSMGINPDK